MNVKFYGIVTVCAVGVLIAFSVVGRIIETSGIVSTPQNYRIAQLIAVGIGLILFFIIGFAAVPVVVHIFILAQIKIGNGEHPVVKFLKENERHIVYGFWAFYAVGSLIAVPAMIYDVAFGKL